ncbi:Hypothetical predicted protein [Paramuricea clavata]|uniref:Uncharacterized protein n=1 Tax=Paramuricea clavata TaxID=317549 RepID=A0A6S7FV36_PARCT|nr:Hypothetical predicted protein [Paramuricea clavata]
MSDSTSDSDDTTTATYLSDSNDLDGSSNPKKAKVMKEKFPFIDKVSDDIYSFYCNICKRSVKCSHMGITNIEKHVGNQMHIANVKAARGQRTINFPRNDSPLIEKTTRAEVKIATMLVKHNIPLAVVDELTPLFQDVFSDRTFHQGEQKQHV